MSKQPSDRREWPRVNLDASAVIKLDSLSPEVNSRIVNASQNGLLIDMPAPRPVGTRMHVRVQIQDPRYEIDVTGIIVHVAEGRDAPPGFGSRVGVYLTEAGPDWAALCRRLAKTA